MKNKTTILYGLLAGVITVAYFIAFYFINPRTMLNPVVWWSSLIIYLVAMIMAIKKTTEPVGLRSATQKAFLVFIIANFMFYAFFYTLFGIIDPELVELQKEMMKANPAAADQLKSKDFSVTISGTFLSFLSSLIGGFIISLGIGAVMKQD